MVPNVAVTFGADPELFISNANGVIIGSERLVPEKGGGNSNARVIRDGVQVELNVQPSSCRELIGQRLKHCFRWLASQKAVVDGEIKVDFSQFITLSPETFVELSYESRQFGCQPSDNIYDDAAEVGVNGETYPHRSGGGHPHLGSLPKSIYFDADKHGRFGENSDTPEVDYRRRLVPIFDVLVGNTCVLIDRDPGQVERRKYYGRAGEYRLQPHGIEYRTVSNFWLRNYVLMSLVLGLMRLSVGVLHQTLLGEDLEKTLLENVDFKKVRRAIDQNDARLAAQNFKLVEQFINKHVQDYEGNHRLEWAALCPRKLPLFKKFVKDVQKNGLASVFPQDPLAHWTSLNPLAAGVGWECWLWNKYGG